LDTNQRSTFYELQANNRRNSVLLVLLFLALVGALGLGLDVFFLGFGKGEGGTPVPIATFLGLLFGGLYAMQGWFFGASQVLAASQARAVDLSIPEEKQFQNVVEEMAIAAGIPPPKAYVLPDSDPNAFAVGRDPEHASIAVTKGLLQALDREELQGVVGHEMSHVRNLDIRAMTLVTALFGAAMLLSDVARRGLYWGGGRSSRRDSRDSGGGGGLMLILFLLWMMLAVLAPFLGSCWSSRSRARASTSPMPAAPSSPETRSAWRARCARSPRPTSPRA